MAIWVHALAGMTAVEVTVFELPSLILATTWPSDVRYKLRSLVVESGYSDIEDMSISLMRSGLTRIEIVNDGLLLPFRVM